MAGTFIVSLDCEGKWGAADHIGPAHEAAYTDAKLDKAYEGIERALDKHGVSATYAFTAAFASTPDSFEDLMSDIETLSPRLGGWLDQFKKDWAKRKRDGWFGRELMERARNSGRHEIACHGFSHVPWAGEFADRSALQEEIKLARRVDGFSSQHVTTFVYPRNLIGHTDLLYANGFSGYRDAKPTLGRAFNLIGEFNVCAKADPHTTVSTQPLKIPAGHFLNWRSGLRKKVPAAVTALRWDSILESAAKGDLVAHLWTHPENFVTGHEMHELFDRVLTRVAQLTQEGRLKIQTQAQYVASQLSANSVLDGRRTTRPSHASS